MGNLSHDEPRPDSDESGGAIKDGKLVLHYDLVICVQCGSRNEQAAQWKGRYFCSECIGEAMKC